MGPAVDQALRAGTAPMAITARVGCSRQYVYMRRAALGLPGRKAAAARGKPGRTATVAPGDGHGPRLGSLVALEAEIARVAREVATLKRRRHALVIELRGLDARIVAREGRAPARRAAGRRARAASGA